MIVHVAIKYKDKIYFLPHPNRHHNVIRMIGGMDGPHKEGFLDSDGKFLNRTEAMLVAVECGQLRRREDAQFYQGPELFSEDLW